MEIGHTDKVAATRNDGTGGGGDPVPLLWNGNRELLSELLRGRQTCTDNCFWRGSAVCPWPHIWPRCHCRAALGQVAEREWRAESTQKCQICQTGLIDANYVNLPEVVNGNQQRGMKDGNMNTPDNLKAAQEKVDRAFVAYSRPDKWSDPELQKHLINDLEKATVEFLEVRRQLLEGRK